MNQTYHKSTSPKSDDPQKQLGADLFSFQQQSKKKTSSSVRKADRINNMIRKVEQEIINSESHSHIDEHAPIMPNQFIHIDSQQIQSDTQCFQQPNEQYNSQKYENIRQKYFHCCCYPPQYLVNTRILQPYYHECGKQIHNPTSQGTNNHEDLYHDFHFNNQFVTKDFLQSTLSSQLNIMGSTILSEVSHKIMNQFEKQIKYEVLHELDMKKAEIDVSLNQIQSAFQESQNLSAINNRISQLKVSLEKSKCLSTSTSDQSRGCTEQKLSDICNKIAKLENNLAQQSAEYEQQFQENTFKILTNLNDFKKRQSRMEEIVDTLQNTLIEIEYSMRKNFEKIKNEIVSARLNSVSSPIKQSTQKQSFIVDPSTSINSFAQKQHKEQSDIKIIENNRVSSHFNTDLSQEKYNFFISPTKFDQTPTSSDSICMLPEQQFQNPINILQTQLFTNDINSLKSSQKQQQSPFSQITCSRSKESLKEEKNDPQSVRSSRDIHYVYKKGLPQIFPFVQSTNFEPNQIYNSTENKENEDPILVSSTGNQSLEMFQSFKNEKMNLQNSNENPHSFSFLEVTSNKKLNQVPQ